MELYCTRYAFYNICIISCYNSILLFSLATILADVPPYVGFLYYCPRSRFYPNLTMEFFFPLRRILFSSEVFIFCPHQRLLSQRLLGYSTSVWPLRAGYAATSTCLPLPVPVKNEICSFKSYTDDNANCREINSFVYMHASARFPHIYNCLLFFFRHNFFVVECHQRDLNWLASVVGTPAHLHLRTKLLLASSC